MDWVVSVGARLVRTGWLVRAPIGIYKAGAGHVLGSRFVMLEHVGRKSGSTRHVVLDVFNHPAPDIYVVASGHGGESQWLRNIKVNPRVRLYIAGRGPVPATARLVDQQEADRQLAAYRDRHPRLWAAFKPVLEATLAAPSPTPIDSYRWSKCDSTRRPHDDARAAEVGWLHQPRVHRP